MFMDNFFLANLSNLTKEAKSEQSSENKVFSLTN